jgi:hypothetical protein
LSIECLQNDDVGRRHCGNARNLPGGRYQASYWFEGRRHIASRTFGTKTDGYPFLDDISTTLTRGDWIDPTPADGTLASMRKSGWCNEQRTELRPLPDIKSNASVFELGFGSLSERETSVMPIGEGTLMMSPSASDQYLSGAVDPEAS